MSERDLSTILREHLTDEPPVGVSSDDAIRTGRRQGRLRLALVGGTAAVVLAVAAASLPGLVDDDSGKGRESTSAPHAGVPIPEQLETLAADKLAPLVGELGDPTWNITDAQGSSVDPADADAQYFQLGYHPAGTAGLYLALGGLSPADVPVFIAVRNSCAANEEKGVVSSCEDETLPDGTAVTTSVGPHAGGTGFLIRLLTVAEAIAHPKNVLWGRSVTLTTPDGVSNTVSEYVQAASPDVADWKVPVEVLRAIATDPVLLDPDAVPHETSS